MPPWPRRCAWTVRASRGSTWTWITTTTGEWSHGVPGPTVGEHRATDRGLVLPLLRSGGQAPVRAVRAVEPRVLSLRDHGQPETFPPTAERGKKTRRPCLVPEHEGDRGWARRGTS